MYSGSVSPVKADGWVGASAGYLPGQNSATVKDDPSQPIGAYYLMASRWEVMRAVLEGNHYLKHVAQNYVPQLPNETDECYQRRLASNLFSPYTGRIVDAAIGLIMRKPVVLEGGNEEWWADWATDVDRQGTDLDEFARRLLRTSIGYGHGGILVDYPKAEGIRTLRDETQAQLKPYLGIVDPWDIIGWRQDIRKSGGKLQQVRIREVTTEPDGEFGEAVVEQIRVLEPGKYRLYRRQSRTTEYGQPGGRWEEVESGRTSLSDIPLVATYSKKTGTLVSKPPLLDVGYINLAHYKLQSQHLNALQVAGFPLLVLRGYDDQGSNLQLDVSKALAMPVEGGVEYVEPANQAFAAYQEELDKLADQMSNLGISILAEQKRVSESGLSKQLDKADSHSLLASISLDLEQALQEAINIAAEYAGQEPPVVGLSRDFDVEKLDGGSVTAINTLFGSGLLDQATALEMLRRGEWLGDEVDLDEVMSATEAEQLQSMEQDLAKQEAQMELSSEYEQPANEKPKPFDG